MIRMFFVTLVTLWALAGILPGFVVPWHPYSILGLAFNGDYMITSVKAGFPAARAGIVPGDRLDLARTPFEFKRYIPAELRRGQQVSFAIDHDGKVRYVTLVAARRERSIADNISILLRLTAALLFVVIGTAIVLARPTPMTWAFYLFSVGTTPVWGAEQYLLPLWALLCNDFLSTVAYAVGWGAFLIFALRFPSDHVTGARQWLERATYIFTAVLICHGLYNVFGYTFGAGSELSQRLGIASFGVLYAAGLLAFVDTFSRSVGPVRKRVEWIMLGFALGLTATMTAFTLDILYPGAPVWWHNFLNAVNIVIPLTLGYAVVKHRVIDVRFVVNRALVYGTMTSFLVAIFGMIDWFFSKELVNGRLGTLAEIVTAVALGFWLNSMHRQVESIIDRMFFRERHRVERHLRRVATALSLAVSRKAVAESLVDEPASALRLASAALFERTDDGSFMLRRAIGWGDCALTRLAADDVFVMQLSSEQAPLSLLDTGWRVQGLPGGASRPTIAVPISVRFQLWAFVLYGAHEHGEDMDPDEVAMVQQLAVSAAAAFDHLQAEELSAQIEALTRRMSALQAAPS